MHDYKETYYNRALYQPNLGASKYYNSFDLFPDREIFYGEWASDDEFFNIAMDKLLEGNKPFMSFLITVTAHNPYEVGSKLGYLYKDDFTKNGYSAEASIYLSKLKNSRSKKEVDAIISEAYSNNIKLNIVKNT